MSLKKFIKVYQVIKHPIIISKCVRFFNKKFSEKRFEEGGLWTGKANEFNKEIRDVNIFPLSNMSKSLSEVHWANFLSYYILTGIRNYIAEFPDVQQATVSEIQALRYTEGGHYKFHVDDGPGMHRKYSAILMLNNDYEGGELCFKLDNKEETIKNVPGSLVIWPSNFMYPHMVKPITKGIRYSVVSWMD